MRIDLRGIWLFENTDAFDKQTFVTRVRDAGVSLVGIPGLLDSRVALNMQNIRDIAAASPTAILRGEAEKGNAIRWDFTLITRDRGMRDT